MRHAAVTLPAKRCSDPGATSVEGSAGRRSSPARRPAPDSTALTTASAARSGLRRPATDRAARPQRRHRLPRPAQASASAQTHSGTAEALRPLSSPWFPLSSPSIPRSRPGAACATPGQSVRPTARRAPRVRASPRPRDRAPARRIPVADSHAAPAPCDRAHRLRRPAGNRRIARGGAAHRRPPACATRCPRAAPARDAHACGNAR